MIAIRIVVTLSEECIRIENSIFIRMLFTLFVTHIARASLFEGCILKAVNYKRAHVARYEGFKGDKTRDCGL